MKKIIGLLLIIILIFPFSVMAHEGEEHAEAEPINFEAIRKEAGVLPGEAFYFVDRAAEWFNVNIFTVSTSKKQKGYQEMARERLMELITLADQEIQKERAYQQGFTLYQKELIRSREMIEVILFLDGREIAQAEEFEEATRRQEAALAGIMHSDEKFSRLLPALSTARIENRSIFEFMATKYQEDEEDIEKYGEIVRKHIELIGETDSGEIGVLIRDAEDHIAAGLNLRAYEIMDEAKSLLYAGLF